MRVSELIKAYAADLENPDNEAVLLSEDDDTVMSIVAEAMVKAAEILNKAAEQIEEFEPATESLVTIERIEEMAALAQAFDESGDELLQKQASVIDEILLTIAAPKDVKTVSAEREGQRIEELKKKYHEARDQIHKQDKTVEALKAVKDSQFYKEYKPLQAPLSSRYCPDHSGVQIQRIGEHTYQCEMDKKIYNYETGYTLLSGDKVPGGSVDLQTPPSVVEPNAQFDTRDSRLGNYYSR